MARAKSFGFTPRSGPGVHCHSIINAIIIINIVAILYIIIVIIVIIGIVILYIIIVIIVIFVIMFIVKFKIVIIFTFVIIISSTIVRIITFKLSVMQQTEGLEMGGGCKLPVYCTNQGGATCTLM